MSWKIALLVALINGVLTAAVTIPVAERLMEANDVSNFEGKRGFAIAFVFIPMGFVGGFLLFRFGGHILGPIGAGIVDKALAERN